MNPRGLFVLILSIIYISGCVGSNVADSIPTENLPDSLKLLNKIDETKAYGVNKATGFGYADPEKHHVAQVDVFELKSSQNVEIEVSDRIKLDKMTMNVSVMRGTTAEIIEETITIEGVSVRHQQRKDYHPAQKDSENILYSIMDWYYMTLDETFIRIGSNEYSGETQLSYDEVGLKLTKLIVENLKKNKLV